MMGGFVGIVPIIMNSITYYKKEKVGLNSSMVYSRIII